MKFMCPKCMQLSDAESWDNATIEHFNDDDIYSIQDNEDGSLFVCPKCNEESGREDIG